LLPDYCGGSGFRLEDGPIPSFPDIPEEEANGDEPGTVNHQVQVRLFRPIDNCVNDALLVSVLALKQLAVVFPQGGADRAVVHQMFHSFLLGAA